MKKTWRIAPALAVVLMALSLVACGGDGNSEKGTGDEYVSDIDAVTDTKEGGDTADKQDETREPPEKEGLRFVTEFVEADVPIIVEGVPAGTELSWTVRDLATGRETNMKTAEPSLTLGADSSESLITVKAEGYRSVSIYYSSLPIIYIESDTDFHLARPEYYDAKLTVKAPASYEGQYSGGAKLRLRGNSTAALFKKPFKVKLDKKADLLGIDGEGESRHWVLLANARDPALLRNKALMDFSESIGTEAHISSDYVSLVYNGDYFGVYQLTEHVRVGETSVDVFDWEEYAEDLAAAFAEKYCGDKGLGQADAARISDEVEARLLTDWSWMRSGRVSYNGRSYQYTSLGMPAPPRQNGGFLLEMDFYHQDQSSVAGLMTAYAQPLYFNTPEPEGKESLDSFRQSELYAYAYYYIQSFEFALHSDDFFYKDSDIHYYCANWWQKRAERQYEEFSDYRDGANNGRHYTDFFDIDNLVDNFIFCEVAKNWDSMKNSFFVYKDVDKKAMIGPQWDFDWAWGNETWKLAFGTDTWSPEGWHCRDEGFMVEQYYQEVQWNCILIRDPYFLTKVYEAWHDMRENEIEELVGKGGKIDQLEERLRRPAAANDAQWADVDAFGITFDQSMAKLREFISIRMGWLDRQFADMKTFVESFGVYHASDSVTSPTVSVGGSETTFTVRVSDPEIKTIRFQINGATVVEAAVSGGKAAAKVPNDALTDGLNCVVANACGVGHGYLIDAEHSIPGNYNQIVSNFVTFER